MRRPRSDEAGFTLIEMMVVVALIAVLAAIALPSFFKESRKAKGSSEVAPIFNDIRNRMEQAFQENGTYPASLGETAMHPGTPVATRQSINPLPAAWTAIKIRIIGNDQIFCSYTWVTGLANDSANVGTQGTAFGFVAPAVDWFYLLAWCNLDGNSTTDAYYFSSSVDPTIKSQNDGF